jgi:hypothetical protein
VGQARHHCEQAFEAYVRRRRAPLVVVNEARKSLLPARLQGGPGEGPEQLKSFDYILYGADLNLLVEIKGRRLPQRGQSLQNWVTAPDIASLRRWESLFGAGFCAALVFLYWSDAPIAPPAPGRAEEIFQHAGRWYLLRAVACCDYQRHMTPRSERWDTVHLPTATFDHLSRPLLGATTGHARRRTISTSRIPPVAGAA